MSAGLSEADPLGAGPGPAVIDREWWCSDIENTTSFSMCMAGWRRFGTAPDFPGRKMKGVIAKTTECPMTRKGSGMGLSWLRPYDWIIP